MSVDLIDVGVKAVKAAIKADVDQAEAFLIQTYHATVEIEKGSVKYAYVVSDDGLSVKAIYKGSSGFSYATTLEAEQVKDAARLASAQAKAGTPDPDFKSLPEPKALPTVRGIYDRNVVEMKSEDLVEIAIEIAEAQKIDKRIYSVNSAVRCGWQKIAVVNSLGVECEDESTLAYAGGEAAAKEKGEMSSGFELQTSRKLADVNPSWIGRTAAEHAVKSLFGRKMKTATLPVVLDPIAAANVFFTSIMPGVDAENIQYKRSYLCEKLGEKIGSDLFTVVDDGTHAGGVGSLSFDAEGIPSQRTTIIDRGVLKGYLYDAYTAGKEGRESTGNALRVASGSIFPDYRGRPTIGVRNLIVKPGKGTIEDLISEVDNGILLRATWDRPNLATGEFSGLISDGYRIEDGEVKYATRQTNIGINMIDFFKQISTVAADSRQIYLPSRPYSVITPAIMVEKVTVSGAR
ncbi:MAG: TldD/PmbA family protein [Candidatus Bathyarchaeia archaeon]